MRARKAGGRGKVIAAIVAALLVVGAGAVFVLGAARGSGEDAPALGEDVANALDAQAQELGDANAQDGAWVVVKRTEITDFANQGATSAGINYVYTLDEGGNIVSCDTTYLQEDASFGELDAGSLQEWTCDEQGYALSCTMAGGGEDAITKMPTTWTYAYERDDLGRVTRRTRSLATDGTQEQDAPVSPQAGEDEVLTFSYDTTGNVAGITRRTTRTDEGGSYGLEVSDVYDTDGRLVSSRAESFFGENDSNVVTTTCAWTFSDDGRPVSCTYTSSDGSGTTTQTFSYDENGNVQTSVRKMGYATITTTYEYRYVRDPSEAVRLASQLFGVGSLNE